MLKTEKTYLLTKNLLLMKHLLWMVAVVLTAVLSIHSTKDLRYSYEPPPGKTGAPGENTCAQCHSGGSGEGEVTIAFENGGNTFAYGETYVMNVDVSDPVQSRFGFETTVLDQDDNMAGTLALIDTDNTSLQSSGGRDYVGHRGANSNNTWSFEWTAPDENSGVEQVTFYIAGNAANGNGNTSGDYIYTSMLTATPMVPEQTISLSQGYQFVSTYLVPENPDMLVVTEDLQDVSLDFVRNSAGNTLQKIGPNWINNIGDWVTTEGYLFRMTGDDELVISGTQIASDTPISLESGYQFVGYILDMPVDAEVALSEILNDNLDFVRNSTGNILQKIGPNWVNNIGDLEPGEGYLFRMNNGDELIYQTQ